MAFRSLVILDATISPDLLEATCRAADLSMPGEESTAHVRFVAKIKLEEDDRSSTRRGPTVDKSVAARTPWLNKVQQETRTRRQVIET